MQIADDEMAESGSSPGVNSLISYNRKLRDQLLEARSAHAEELRAAREKTREVEAAKGQVELKLQETEAKHSSEKAAWEAKTAKLVQHHQAEKLEHESQSQAQLDTITVLQQQLDNVTVDLSRSMSRGGSLEKLKLTLLEKARTLKAELAESKAGSAALAAELSERTAERDALKQEITSLYDSHSKLGQLQETVDSLTTELESVTEERDGLLEELEALADSKALLEAAQRQITQLNEQLVDAKSQRDALSQKLESLAGPLARLDALNQENQRLQANLQEQAEEFEKAREYRLQAETREAENRRLAALAEEKVKTAEAAVKAQQAAEQLAFESRRKLLDSYAETEGKEILKDNFEEAQARLNALESELEASRRLAAEWESKHKELEEKMLYSSERDILKRSLENIAKRKSMTDS